MKFYIVLQIAMTAAAAIAFFCSAKKLRNPLSRYHMSKVVCFSLLAVISSLLFPPLALSLPCLFLLADEAFGFRLSTAAGMSVLGILPVLAAFLSPMQREVVPIGMMLFSLLTMVFAYVAFSRIFRIVHDIIKGMSLHGFLLVRRRQLLISCQFCLYLLTSFCSFVSESSPGGWPVLMCEILWTVWFCYLFYMNIADIPFVLSRSRMSQIYKELSESEMLTVRADITYGDVYRRIRQSLWVEKAFLKTSFNVDLLSAEVYSNRQYVSKAIAAYKGVSLPQYVQKCRVMYSLQVLRAKPSMSISDLSAFVGFRRPGQFRSAFLTIMEMTPEEWKETMNLPESAHLPESMML